MRNLKTNNPLTGEKLLKKIDKLGIKDIRELAIQCGYYTECFGSNGKPVVKALMRKFKTAVTEAGGDAEQYVIDPYARQKKYIKKNRARCTEYQRDWREENQDKVKHYKMVHAENDRESARLAYHKRKALEKAVAELALI